MVWICLDRQSTTTRMALYPFESGSSPIMSIEITCQCQSGTLLGISFPTFCVGKVFVWCRWENGLMCIPPMETSFGHWNMLLLLQDENPIIGRIFAGNTNIQFFRCLPNRDVISSLNPPNSHDPNGGTYVRIGGLLKEKRLFSG